MDRLLTVGETSGVLGVHPQTVYKLVKDGDLPAIRRRRLGIRFRREDIEAWIAKGKQTPPPAFAPFPIFPGNRLKISRPHDKKAGGGISEMAKAKSKSRMNLGYGAVYQRKTKTGNVRWYVDYRDADGKRIQKLVPHAVNEDEAILALRVDVSKALSSSCGIHPPKTAVSFAEFAESFKMNYLSVERKNWKSDDYRLNHAAGFFRGKKINEIDSQDIREFKKERLEKGNSERTVNRYLALLKRMFNVAIEQGDVKENPVKQVKFFSERDTNRSRVLSQEEERRLLAECPETLRSIVVFALHSGLRIGEIRELKWSQVDFSQKRVVVERTKGKNVRFIRMNHVLLKRLGALKKHAGERESVFGFKSIRTAFENACRRAEIEGLTFHDLRRTFGTRLLEEGTDIVTIQRLYGHSSVLVTQLYLNPDDRLADEAVERLAEKTTEEQEVDGILLHPCDTESTSVICISPSDSKSIN